MCTCRDTANAAHLAGFNLSRVGKCLKVHSCSTSQEILSNYVRRFITMSTLVCQYSLHLASIHFMNPTGLLKVTT
jgi:hypothetical protein